MRFKFAKNHDLCQATFVLNSNGNRDNDFNIIAHYNFELEIGMDSEIMPRF